MFVLKNKKPSLISKRLERQWVIFVISKIIKENIKEGDRCLLVSENRPEWFVSDLAIMLSGGITVPAYTTYTEDDYKYLIDDCEPTIVIVSNNEILKKLNTTIILICLWCCI